MNLFTMKLFISLLQSAPQLATDIENAIKTAETPEAGQAKLKAYLSDFENALKAIIGVL